MESKLAKLLVDWKAAWWVHLKVGQKDSLWVDLKVEKDKKMVDLMDVKLVYEKVVTRVDPREMMLVDWRVVLWDVK